MKNEKYRISLWVGASLIVLMGLIPPWCWHGPNGMIQARYYALIFLPPDGCAIDTDRLFLQWLLIAIVCAAWIKLGQPPKQIPIIMMTMLMSWTAFHVFAELFISNTFNPPSIVKTLLRTVSSRSSASHVPDFSDLPPVKKNIIPDSVSASGNVDLSDVKNLPSLNALPRLP